MSTQAAAKKAVKNIYPMAYASKHTNQMGRFSHVCVWTRLHNGKRLSTGKTFKDAWQNALAAAKRINERHLAEE